MAVDVKQLENFNRKKKKNKSKIVYVNTSISMPKKLFEKIEEARGRTPRSVFIADIVIEKLGVEIK